ncbi:MAG: hypothetical protein M1817_004918 [Caeruleum heppii]|nr:MAG: hypothetical protein M1817_004918 [Caeruleum heppii]
MESVIFEDSPLAQYLEGQGEAGSAWSTTAAHDDGPSLSQPFAPRGPSTLQAKFRQKLPQNLRLRIPEPGTVARIHDTCSRAVNSRLGRADNARFLEQFRYIIVASQLLSGESNTAHYNPIEDAHELAAVARPSSATTFGPINLTGVIATAGGAFGLVWVIHWAVGRQQLPSRGRVLLALLPLVLLATILYTYVRRRWLHYLRQQAVASTSDFLSNSRGFDATTLAAITLIQEVELVSRGYRISTPLPPVSRLEDRSQSRRCARLRRTLHSSLEAAILPFIEACATLRPLAEDVDLDKYFDIYDLSIVDLNEAQAGQSNVDIDDWESLKALKLLFHRVQTLRRIVLCCLLALDADGGKPDFVRWKTAVDEVQRLDSMTSEVSVKLRKILNEEEHFAVPSTPKSPVPPGRERVRAQLRKLSSLSQGIRGLQAKLHVLREESDKTLDEAVDVTELGSNLMAQYDSIGGDLKMLMQEWEDGKASLASNIDKNEKRISQASSGLRSPTSSLGGMTIVDGNSSSPSEALTALDGEDRARWSMSLSSGDNEREETFEAFAVPRQRSTLSREERIARMKEERLKLASHKDRVQANTNMLLLEARLEQANLLKKVVDAIRDLVQDCNFDCNDSGIALQAMDNSHVALVSMMLKAEGFSPFRCDRNIALGINLTSLTKVLRCAQNEDVLTLKADDAPDSLNLVFESSESDRFSEYDIKLMDIDQDHLGIPETEYAATITMPATEFQKICRDLMALSESVTIEATKEGIKFQCTGDIGSGAVTLRQHANVEKPSLNVDIELSEPVSLTFSLKYLVNFCKASGLSETVKLCLSNEVPLLVEYALAGSSYLRFYLAPKIGEDE